MSSNLQSGYGQFIQFAIVPPVILLVATKKTFFYFDPPPHLLFFFSLSLFFGTDAARCYKDSGQMSDFFNIFFFLLYSQSFH